MTDPEALAVKRENDYLKTRNAQLQSELTDVSAEVQRLRQELSRRGGLSALGPEGRDAAGRSGAA